MFDRAIGFAPSGNYWRHLRRIASTHMFSPKRVSALEGFRQSVANNMIEEVRRAMAERGVVELRGILQKGSLDNVLESVFGSSDLGFGGFLDFGGVKRKCHKLAARVKDLVSKIIKERRKIGDFTVRNDFLSVLLSLPEEEQLSDADMVAVLWV
ncbi:UNVERIFIED_CONTAM: cytochrome [Sesamum radiatum]|uniref:Cytochrome n=1 Tax=Sesamum radiatum TaxID=300843 RepID=A0AAW2S0T5_SESRA